MEFNGKRWRFVEKNGRYYGTEEMISFCGIEEIDLFDEMRLTSTKWLVSLALHIFLSQIVK